MTLLLGAEWKPKIGFNAICMLMGKALLLDLKRYSLENHKKTAISPPRKVFTTTITLTGTSLCQFHSRTEVINLLTVVLWKKETHPFSISLSVIAWLEGYVLETGTEYTTRISQQYTVVSVGCIEKLWGWGGRQQPFIPGNQLVVLQPNKYTSHQLWTQPLRLQFAEPDKYI